jgi:beta-phosphoglucomutase-like phosphatase (HAD superfamily)
LEELNKINCIKAIVSGSSKNEAQHLIEKKIGMLNFDIVITGDEVTKGKPHPQPFITALNKTNLDRENVLIVENSPFGVIGAHHANISYIVTLNSTPLTVVDFYNFLSIPIKNEFNKYIFKNTRAAKGFILDWIFKS